MYSKPKVSIHLCTPQVYTANSPALSRDGSVLFGYATVDIAKPTKIRSLELTLSGKYSMSWTRGVGPSRQEYAADYRFYKQSVSLSQWQPVSSSASNCSSKGCSGGCSMANLSENLINVASFPSSPFGSCFTLQPGSYTFAFGLSLPQTLPSTVISSAGGIRYMLTLQLKRQRPLLPPHITCTSVPVHIISLPPRLAYQSPFSAPGINTEPALLTKQIDDALTAHVQLMTRCVCPGEPIKVSFCLSQGITEQCSVRMTLVERTVYNPRLAVKCQRQMETVITSTVHDLSDIVGYPSSNNSNNSNLSSGLPADAIKYELSLLVPRMIDAAKPRKNSAADPASSRRIHTSCSSAHAIISHTLYIALQIGDQQSQTPHQVYSFKTRIDIVPDPESYNLPSYELTSSDTLVVC